MPHASYINSCVLHKQLTNVSISKRPEAGHAKELYWITLWIPGKEIHHILLDRRKICVQISASEAYLRARNHIPYYTLWWSGRMYHIEHARVPRGCYSKCAPDGGRMHIFQGESSLDNAFCICMRCAQIYRIWIRYFCYVLHWCVVYLKISLVILHAMKHCLHFK